MAHKHITAAFALLVLHALLYTASANSHHKSSHGLKSSIKSNLSDHTSTSTKSKRGADKCYAFSTASAAAAPDAASVNNGAAGVLYNHGGDVMTHGITVHYLWVGDWSGGQKGIVKAFTDSISTGDGGATVPKWWAINTQYTDKSGRHVTGSVHNGHEASFPRQQFGSADSVAALVAGAVSSGKLPADENAVYAVLGDAGTTQVGLPLTGYERSRYCVTYCGWHGDVAVGGKDLKFLFTANAGHMCPMSCIYQPLVAGTIQPPNGDLGVDGMVSIFAHELAEAASDPYLDAWADEGGNENADKCQYKYGKIQGAGGAGYNMVGAGGHKFLVQQNWDEASQSCQTFK